MYRSRDCARVEARLRKKELSFQTVHEFQQRLCDLPLSLVHLAVDPNCYTGTANEGDVSGSGEARAADSPSLSSSPNLKLPKVEIFMKCICHELHLYNVI
jgi:hypothetical protein